MDEDIELVKSFKAEDKTAFDKLVLKYKNKVFNLCYRMLGNYEDANDSAQDTFVKVFCSLDKFRMESTFSTWLYRIAVNTCKNKFVSVEYRYREKTVRIDDPDESEEGSHKIEIRDESLSPGAELERKEKEALIQKAIAALPKEQKAVVVLRDINGMSYEEVAKVTGYNLGTVKSKLARARQALREKLRGAV